MSDDSPVSKRHQSEDVLDLGPLADWIKRLVQKYNPSSFATKSDYGPEALPGAPHCRLIWDSPMRGPIRCLRPATDRHGPYHTNEMSFIAVGSEQQLNGRWIE